MWERSSMRMLPLIRNMFSKYLDTLEFNQKREFNYHLRNVVSLKRNLINLGSYNFNKIHNNLTKSEFKCFKELIERKELVIQKADKGNTVVISDYKNYLKGLKSLFG